MIHRVEWAKLDVETLRAVDAVLVAAEAKAQADRKDSEAANQHATCIRRIHMGYTHYYTQNAECPPEAWARIVADFHKLLQAIPVQIVGWDGEPGTEPQVDDEVISFNGEGTEGCETMKVKRNGSDFEFCKTRLRPYDTLVTALLMTMEHHAPGVWEIGSDGDARDWEAGRELTATALGRAYDLPPRFAAA